MNKGGHSERAHSKFAASGAKRWFECPGSVELSEGQPDIETPQSKEGTQAHEVLEDFLKTLKIGMDLQFLENTPTEMLNHARDARDFIRNLLIKSPQAELLAEKRVYLDFIHPEMFGTFDASIIEYFGTLHIFDYKYGKYLVSPKKNLQMLFYAIGMAYLHHWNFLKARLWIIQPRAKGYDGPLFWDVPILELKAYVPVFRKAVNRVLKNPTLKEGEWCFFCRAKSICPLKLKKKVLPFTMVPLQK